MSRIKELPKNTSHLLSCTQIITSVQSVIKELIENSLDSSATNIAVELESFGFGKIIIRDNGSGIVKEDMLFIAKPHCTSKITKHSDLSTIETYGFRGEALSALCSMSELIIATKNEEATFGQIYTFDFKGNIMSSKPYPCNNGTVITATNLFKNVPVRMQYYKDNKKKIEELKKVEDVLLAFACIHPSVRFTLHHNGHLIWQKSSVCKTKEALIQVFGHELVDHMQHSEHVDEKSQVKIEMFVAKSSLNNPSRSMVAVNRRPIRMKKIDKVLREYFVQSIKDEGSKNRYPICFIAIDAAPSNVDVNLDPNKATVAMKNIDSIVNQLSKMLGSFIDTSINSVINKAAHHENTFEKTSASREAQSKAELPNIDSGFPNLDHLLIQKTSKADLPFPNVLNKLSIVENNIINENILGQRVQKLPFQILKPVQTNTLSISPMKAKDISIYPKNVDKSGVIEKTYSKVDFLNTTPNEILRKIPTQPPMFNKLSRKNNAFTPISKRIRRNSSSANDVHHHIQTINSFFAASNDKTHATDQTAAVGNVVLHRKDLQENNINQSDLNFLQEVNLNCPNQSSTLDVNSGNQKKYLEFQQSLKTKGINASFHKDNQGNDLNITMINSPKIIPTVINEDVYMNSNQDMQENNPATTHIVSNQNQTLPDLLQEGSHMLKNCVPVSDINGVVDENSKKVCHGGIPLEDGENHLPGADKLHSSRTVNETGISNHIQKPVEFKSVEWSRGSLPTELELAPITVLVPNKSNVTPQSSISFPQRKTMPFDIFCRNHRLEIAALHPEFNNQQIAQVLTKKWSKLSDEAKAVYKNDVQQNYPKNIKNKQKLNKTVSRSLAETYLKRKRRLKKRIEKNLSFNIDKLKEPSTVDSSNNSSENLCVLNAVASGVWACCQTNSIFLLNVSRLQETVIFNNLMNTYKFSMLPLDKPLPVPVREEDAACLSWLEQINYSENTSSIIDNRLLANGFKTRFLKDSGVLEIVGLTDCLAFFGAPDLLEIISLLKKNGPTATLSQCRPGKIILYLQGESVRIARRCSANPQKADVEDLLFKKEPQTTLCLHSKPILQEIYTIIERNPELEECSDDHL